MAHSPLPQAWRNVGASASPPPLSTWGIPSQPPASSARTAATWTPSHRFCGNWEQSFNLERGSDVWQMEGRNPPSPCPASAAPGSFSPAACAGAPAYRSWTRLRCRQAVSARGHPPARPLCLPAMAQESHYHSLRSCSINTIWAWHWVIFSTRR